MATTRRLTRNPQTQQLLPFMPISVSLAYAGSTVKHPVTALIDSGASHTVISPSLIDRLELRGRHTSFAMVKTLNGPGREHIEEVHPVYRVSLHLPGIRPVVTLEALETAIAHTASDILIGMDILHRCVFTLDGPKGAFSLSMPMPSNAKHVVIVLPGSPEESLVTTGGR